MVCLLRKFGNLYRWNLLLINMYVTFEPRDRNSSPHFLQFLAASSCKSENCVIRSNSRRILCPLLSPESSPCSSPESRFCSVPMSAEFQHNYCTKASTRNSNHDGAVWIPVRLSMQQQSKQVRVNHRKTYVLINQPPKHSHWASVRITMV